MQNTNKTIEPKVLLLADADVLSGLSVTVKYFILVLHKMRKIKPVFAGEKNYLFCNFHFIIICGKELSYSLKIIATILRGNACA